MSRKSTKTPAPPKVVVNEDASLALPPARKPAGQTSVGVTGVRRTTAPADRQVGLTAYAAGTASDALGKPGATGGAAFARWCREQGIPESSLRPLAEWGPLLKAFASRPVHGHSRNQLRN